MWDSKLFLHKACRNLNVKEKNCWSECFSGQFRKLIIRCKRTDTTWMLCDRQRAWLLTQSWLPTVNCTSAGRASGVMMASAWKRSVKLVFWSGSQGFKCWTSVVPAFQCWSCCWVLVLFHLSVEPWFICLLFWYIDELEARTEKLVYLWTIVKPSAKVSRA